MFWKSRVIAEIPHDMASAAGVRTPNGGWEGDRHPLSWRRFAIFSALLVLCFAKPLFSLVRYAEGSGLYSHILLVPFISLYLGWMNREKLALDWGPSARGAAMGAFFVGCAVLATFWIGAWSGWELAMDDYLGLMLVAFLAFLLSGGFVFLGRTTLGRLAFPFGFLIFMAPFPTVALSWIETFLQRYSADAACAMFTVAGMPVLPRGTQIRLPGFSLEVAPECSGIHSTLVLVLTSLLAGYMFLRTPWRRAILVVAVVPLAVLRNGFRIFTIGELCVNVSPDMIHSYIHRRGGPIFFAMSMVPFFLLLFVLRKTERRNNAVMG